MVHKKLNNKKEIRSEFVVLIAVTILFLMIVVLLVLVTGKDFFVLDIDVSGCSVLDQANTVYNQTADIANNTIAGACINITAENITFNGNGFSITSGQNVSGVFSNKFNTTIRHTNVSMGIGTGGNGIYLVSSANNATVFNNTLGTQFRGILLENARYGVFERNNFSYSCANCYGVFTTNASFNNFTLNTLLGTDLISTGATHGIQIRDGSDNNILTSNTAKMDLGIGLTSLNASHNIYIKNTGTSRNTSGITHTNAVNYTLTFDNGTNTIGDGSTSTKHGIRLFNVSNSTFTSVIASSNSSSGLSLQESFNNKFVSVIGVSNVSGGIRIENSSNNVFTNSQALGLLSGSYGFLLFNATGTNITDCSNVSGVANDIYIDVENRSTVLITNCSYDSESVNGAANNLTRQWYYRAIVKENGGALVRGANVSAYNRTGQNIFTIGPTNTSGFTNRTEIIEYVNLGVTRTYYSNYTINATNGSSTNEHAYNVTLTGNSISDEFTFNVIVFTKGTGGGSSSDGGGRVSDNSKDSKDSNKSSKLSADKYLNKTIPSHEESTPVELDYSFEIRRKEVSDNCKEDWQCSAWGACNAFYTLDDLIKENLNLKGIEERSCVDTQDCFYDRREKRLCSPVIPITTKKVSVCLKEYVEVYNGEGKLISRVELMKEAENKKLTIQFAVKNTIDCSYCYDGIQDFDEEGVDCGPSCGSCVETPKSLYTIYQFPWGIVIGIVIIFIALSILFYLKK